MTPERIKGNRLVPEGTNKSFQVMPHDAVDHIASLLSTNRIEEARTYAAQILSQLVAKGVPLTEEDLHSFDKVCLPDLDRIIHGLKDPNFRPILSGDSNTRIKNRIYGLLSQKGIHLKAA